MNRAKQVGTAWESRIVAYLIERGWVNVERRALAGAMDKGDIAGIPGVVIEAKSHNRIALAGWLSEAESERVTAAAKIGVVWAKRKGKSSAADGYVIMSGATFADLLKAAGW